MDIPGCTRACGNATIFVLTVGPIVMACQATPPSVEGEGGDLVASPDDMAVAPADAGGGLDARASSEVGDATDVVDAGGAGDATGAGDASTAADATGATDATDGAAVDAPADSVSGGNTCSLLANTASLISQMDLASELPSGTGGLIVDGLYYRTKDTVYTGWHGTTGPTGYVGRGTLSVHHATTTKASIESVVTRPGLADVGERFTLEPLGGVEALLDFTCPVVTPYKVQYSVRNGATVELDLHVGPNRIATFTRQ